MEKFQKATLLVKTALKMHRALIRILVQQCFQTGWTLLKPAILMESIAKFIPTLEFRSILGNTNANGKTL